MQIIAIMSSVEIIHLGGFFCGFFYISPFITWAFQCRELLTSPYKELWEAVSIM